MKTEEPVSTDSSFFTLHSSFASRVLCWSFRSRWRKWEPNPILLKELRQAVRNRAFVSMLMLLLAALFLVIAAISAGLDIAGSRNQPAGQIMLDALIAVLTVITLVFVPLYTGIRLAVERHQPDLIFFTLVSDGKIVRGKLSSGLCLAILFFSACAPFMAFTILFGGVDLPTILFVLSVLFASVCVAVLGAIAAACVPLYLPPKMFFGALFTLGLIFGCGFLIMFFFGVVRSGIGTLMQSRDFWGYFTPSVIAGALVLIWLYAVAVSAITSVRHPDKFRQNAGTSLDQTHE